MESPWTRRPALIGSGVVFCVVGAVIIRFGFDAVPALVGGGIVPHRTGGGPGGSGGGVRLGHDVAPLRQPRDATVGSHGGHSIASRSASRGDGVPLLTRPPRTQEPLAWAALHVGRSERTEHPVVLPTPGGSMRRSATFGSHVRSAVRLLWRSFADWRARLQESQRLCRHDGSAPMCVSCAWMRFHP